MSKSELCFVIAILCFASVNTKKNLKFYEEKNFHEAQELTDQNVRDIAAMSDMNHFKSVLNEILIPRVVGTPNHDKVSNYISQQMRDLGATDSAVPCTMMINLAKVMSEQLEPIKNNRLSIMFIFFDGEEAFRQWGPNDSIYGARHLAKKWHGTEYKDGANELQRMDVMVLLDLLGCPDPVFYSYFQSTEKWYVRLAVAEQRLAELDQFQSYSKGQAEQTYFRLRSSGAVIEDDHIPFMRRNVDILHVIPSPFPSVWHTAGDNLSALDFNTIENLNKIFRVFVAEYLHIKPK
ncbi:hypothetical protein HF086_015987 [Spodoptera exigua]|uniref:glutaminyl-peptide cyclotransferase n=1 Tax=Spodoptera exigua TaxID=7107 RepID=A0A922MPC2_SPOEX|nr:hypothetical protein HF086_015987 [Spodoptera exigua]